MAARRKKTRGAKRKPARRKSKTPKKSTRKKATPRKAAKKKAAGKRVPRAPARKKAARRRTAHKKAARKKAARKRRVRTRAQRHWNPIEAASARQTVDALVAEARRIHRVALRGQRPELKTPQRSLSNVTLSKAKGYLEIGRKRIVRSLTVNTVRTFAQTLKFMALSKEMIGIDDMASKREVYYQSINWGHARFKDQAESDGVMDDVEAMFSIHGVSREQLRFAIR